MQYSIYRLIRNTAAVILIFHASSCAKEDTELNEVYAVAKENNIDTSNLEEVYILSSEECMACNKSFSTVIESKFDKLNTAIIILADPTRINLSAYKNHKNVAFVDQAKKSQLNFLYKSKVLFLKNQKVQDSIVIDAHNLEKQLNRLRNG